MFGFHEAKVPNTGSEYRLANDWARPISIRRKSPVTRSTHPTSFCPCSSSRFTLPPLPAAGEDQAGVIGQRAASKGLGSRQDRLTGLLQRRRLQRLFDELSHCLITEQRPAVPRFDDPI